METIVHRVAEALLSRSELASAIAENLLSSDDFRSSIIDSIVRQYTGSIVQSPPPLAACPTRPNDDEQPKKRKRYVYRYLLKFPDGKEERYCTLTDLQKRFKISKWMSEQIVKDTDKCFHITGANMERTHCTETGNTLPIIRRDLRYNK